jgi:CO/xanthine dehydrogenase Mo-binding subunit
MNDADDATAEAAFLSQAVGKPVRFQYMRSDGTGWDPKSPPSVTRMRGGLDAQGNVVAWDFESRGFSARLRPSGTTQTGDTLAGQLMGLMPKGEDRHPLSTESYGFPNKRKVGHVIAWEQSIGTGLRTAHFRDPNGPQTAFPSESFIDEMAAAAGADPVEFRLRYLRDPRDIAVVKAAAQGAGWDPRPSPKKQPSNAVVVSGRGIAYAPRNETYVAIVCEVDVNRQTGQVKVKRFVCGHDCGMIMNPGLVEATIEANILQTMSRAFHEEVQFDGTTVKSVDWSTYPILDMTEVPEAIEIVVLNNSPEYPPRGVGEPATRPTVPAIANAIFDATGVRMRRVPFTPERVKAALTQKREA